MVRAGILGAVVVASGGGAGPAEQLREAVRSDAATHVVLEMKAAGELRPEAGPGAEAPRPVVLRVESRFDYFERVLVVGTDGTPGRAARQVRQAAVAINGDGRRALTTLRPEVGLLMVDWRDGEAVTVSPGGPLTRPELDVVQGPADPLVLGRLLPGSPVAVGETWPLGAEIARSLSDYDALAVNTLKAKLEALDASTARVHLAGEVRGAARGGEGTVTIDGSFTFDREAGLITQFDLERSEERKPGQVEPGFTFRGTLSLRRTPSAIPERLTDAALEPLPAPTTPGLALLRFAAPDGSYSFLHDRDWHLFWDDARVAVFKRLDHGEFVAQCNLAVGPNAGKGRHQDPAQFRADIRAALGSRFVAFLGESDVSESAADLFVHRIAVQGREADHGVVWYYYLIASPEGEQLLATFTLNAEDVKRFGNQDLQLIGSLQFRAAAESPPAE